jgi:hypothetical protein
MSGELLEITLFQISHFQFDVGNQKIISAGEIAALDCEK